MYFHCWNILINKGQYLGFLKSNILSLIYLINTDIYNLLLLLFCSWALINGESFGLHAYSFLILYFLKSFL